MKADTINIDLRAQDLTKENIFFNTEKLLTFLDESFLPKPLVIDAADSKKIKISGYLDPEILHYTEAEFKKRQLPFSLDVPESGFYVSICPAPYNYTVRIRIPSEIQGRNIVLQVRDLFVQLCKLLNPDIGKVYLSEAFSKIQEKHFEWEGRTAHFTFFNWLQYFGKHELQRQGGEDAIFQNPYIKAERLGEGILIEVGNDPFEAHTPEGEELIVKATRALPPVVKD